MKSTLLIIFLVVILIFQSLGQSVVPAYSGEHIDRRQSFDLINKKVDGYCITKSHDTVKIKVILPIIGNFYCDSCPYYSHMQYGIHYYQSANYDSTDNEIVMKRKQRFIYPCMVTELSFVEKGERVKLLSGYKFSYKFPYDINSELLDAYTTCYYFYFMRVIRDGKLKLLEFYPNVYSGGSEKVNFFQKEQGPLIEIHKSACKFMKHVLPELFDCPGIVKYVEEDILIKSAHGGCDYQDLSDSDIIKIVEEYNRTTR